MKCSHCKKRMQVTLVFSCTCEKTFCVHCRLPEAHACPTPPKKELALPPAVIAPKVEKL